MKRHFVTYGDAAFAAAKTRIANEASATGEFDEVIAYGPEDVSPDVRQGPLWNEKRGGGYWTWKPDIILQSLNRAEDNDIVVYVDSGCEVGGGGEWKKYWRILQTKELIVQGIYQVNRNWTRQSAIDFFNDIQKEWLNRCQFLSGIIFFRKTQSTMQLVSEWRDLMLRHPEIVKDVTPAEYAHEPPFLKENRHDQTVLSALIYRRLANPQQHNFICAKWEHVENLSPCRSQVIRAFRNRTDKRVSFGRKLKEMALRAGKDLLRKPYFMLAHGIGLKPQAPIDAVFAQAAFQFCGHIDEYLIHHARHVGIFYVQTRFGKGKHLYRQYENGKLTEERQLAFSNSIVGYYLQWLWHWNRELTRFCRGRGNVVAIVGFPLGIIGKSFRRKVRYVYWQWDYFPGAGFVDKLFNAAARWCSRHCGRYVPLTKAIGRAMGIPDADAIMLGVTPPSRFGNAKSNRILMVGQLRHGQGVENVLDFIATHPQYQLSLMGAAANGFGEEISRHIASAQMADRVYFPNKFVSDAELRNEAAKCFVSLALYDTSPSNLTHYADPGKVKSSIEMGLPIVMTRISDIVPFIERFKAGEVIDSLEQLPAAIAAIRQYYPAYQDGLRAFADHFDCERYYKDLLS